MEKSLISTDIKQQFLELYNNGTYKHGQKIPSEAKMSKHFGVSRETWRSVVKTLIKEGILFSKQGSGTYICEKPHVISNDLSVLSSLYASLGGDISQSVYSCVIDSVDNEISNLFHETNNFFIINRVRYQNNIAVSSSINYIPAKYALDVDNIPNSLFTFFQETHNIKISKAVSEILVPNPEDDIYKRLNLPEGINALQLNQLHFDNSSTPIFYSCDYLRCDKFKFTINRTR